MDFFKFRYYIEVLAIALGITFLICELPLQAFVEKEVSMISFACNTILWYTIIFHNATFHFLMDKWFKR
ncbi:hypothetical protein ABRT01_14665 [Lentibacillus sp. L22]|uniref:hypothetical protein n=1 Tax=Lentibacillus TaxID=175304 RepID=UPI0022B1D2C1|nr:hypothetical protein [Lentibacillus daqui]